MTENTRLIAGNLVKVNLPSEDRRFKKILLKIDSKFTQIGDENKIIGLEFQRRQSEAEGVPNVRRLDLNYDSERNNSKIFIEALAVQLNVGSTEQIEIEVKSDEASSLQIGDQCKIHIQDKSKAEVNNEVGNTSGCRRELLARTCNVMTGAVARPKHRKRKKPSNKTVSLNNGKLKKQTKTAPIDSSECLELYQMFFDKVQRILHPLRDNGNWSLFDEKWKELLVKYGDDSIWKALLMLEFGIRIMHNSKFASSYLKEAEKTLREGWQIIKGMKEIDPNIKQFFEGRYYCYLTSVYRRTKFYRGAAEEALGRAERIFNNTANTSFLYDKANVFYEKGSRYHEFHRKGVDKEAKESFEKCYELCRQVSRETGRDFIVKGKFALLKKVMVLLGCSTEQGRKTRIRNEDLEEAKKCIIELDKENKTRRLIPIGEQLQLLLAKSDSYFRMDDFINAAEMARQAVDLADQHGFDAGPASKRLQGIEVRPEGPRGNVETVDYGVSCDDDGSASQSTGTSSSSG